MNAIYIAQCQFCGCVESYVDEYLTGPYIGKFNVVCDYPECYAKGPLGLTEEEAIEKWNERAEPVK